MGLIQKVGNFLGVDKFAKGLATTARVLTGELNQDIQTQTSANDALQKLTYVMKNEKDPAKKKQLQQLIQSHVNSGGAMADEIDPGLDLTNKEIIGSAANVALNVLLPGAFKGGTASVIAKNAALGSAFGAASGLEKNRNTSGIIGSTVGGALTGAAIGSAGIAAGKVKNAITNSVPQWLMDKAIKPALQDLKKNVKYGTKTLSQELLDEGVKGSPAKLLQTADAKMNQYENELQSHLESPGLADARITRDRIFPYLKDTIEQKKGVPGMANEVKKIEGVVNSMPEEITLLEANRMKRRIYNELRDPAYKLDAKLSTKAQTLKAIARGLKTEIENTVGGTVINDINRKLSIYGRMENAVVDQVARGMRNNGISLTDAIIASGGLVGSMVGQKTNNDKTITPLSFLTALGLILARHNSTLVDTYAAQGLKKTGEVLGNKTMQGVKDQVIRRTGFNFP